MDEGRLGHATPSSCRARSRGARRRVAVPRTSAEAGEHAGTSAANSGTPQREAADADAADELNRAPRSASGTPRSCDGLADPIRGTSARVVDDVPDALSGGPVRRRDARGRNSAPSRDPGSVSRSTSRRIRRCCRVSSRATESAIFRTVSISWVMKTIGQVQVVAQFPAAARPPSRSWWGRVPAVASSDSSTDGRSASARAMPTRCRWPPESWKG